MKNKIQLKERYRYLATPDAIKILISIQSQEFEPADVDFPIDEEDNTSSYDMEIKGLLVSNEDESNWINRCGYTATSYEYIRQRIDELIQLPQKDIHIYVNSPGGYVAGIEKVIKKMENLKNHKVIHIHTDGMIASAAYWIASISNDITASSFAQIGSIGAYTTMTDLSEMYRSEGIKVHLISSGSLKGAGEYGIEITKEQVDAEQSIINGIAEKFYQSVEKYRFISGDYKTGGIYLADEALKMGLIEIISDEDDTINVNNKETIKMSKKVSKKSAVIKAKSKKVTSEEDLDEDEIEDAEDNLDKDDLAVEDEDIEEEDDELNRAEDEEDDLEDTEDNLEDDLEELEEEDELAEEDDEEDEEDEAEEEKARCLALIEAFAFNPGFVKKMIKSGKSVNEAKVIAYDKGIHAKSDTAGVAKIDNTISGISVSDDYSKDHPMVAKARRLAAQKDIPLYKAMEILNKKDPAAMSDYIFRG